VSWKSGYQINTLAGFKKDLDDMARDLGIVSLVELHGERLLNGLVLLVVWFDLGFFGG